MDFVLLLILWNWLLIAWIPRRSNLPSFPPLIPVYPIGLLSLGRVGSLPLPQVVPPSRTLINYSTASFHHVAAGLTRAPDFCFALRSQLGSCCGTASCPAGLGTLISKPRPPSYLFVQKFTWWWAGVAHPVRVSTAAEYFRLIPSFKNSDSISHSFPSIAEARVYCAAVGIAFPDQQ